MSQRRRFFEALSLLAYTEDWGGLEYVEDMLEHKRGEVLAQFLAEHNCQNCPFRARRDNRRVFEIAFSQQISRVIE